MNPKKQKYDVGILVGRFQVHELHAAHLDLIQSVCDRHNRVILFLGLSPVRNTKRNPLDFNARKQMIQESFSDIEIHYIHDIGNDLLWSKTLDREIARWTNQNQTILLYGGRDSFISHYHGEYETCELEPEFYVSGKEMRDKISAKTMSSKEFRAGAIWASYNRHDTSYTTVDVAILDEDNKRVLLAGKNNDGNLYRFVGGFSDPLSESLEEDAKREAKEETGVIVSEPKYLGSTLIDDWRYRNESDKIKTTFWVCNYVSGTPEAMDDIDRIRYFNLDIGAKALKEQVVRGHHGLIDKLYDYLDCLEHNK